MKARNIIRRIRRAIPPFECKPGCTECCGPVRFTSWEWARISDKRKWVSLDCPYIGPSGCDVYADRPIICRLYGTTPALRCPHGCGPDKELTEKEAYNLMDLYTNLGFVAGVGGREFLPAGVKIATLLDLLKLKKRL